MSYFSNIHPDYLEAFVGECHKNGFNEKQAAELLKNYLQASLYNSDESFQEGFNSVLKAAADADLKKKSIKLAATTPGITDPFETSRDIAQRIASGKTPMIPQTVTTPKVNSNIFGFPTEVLALRREMQKNPAQKLTTNPAELKTIQQRQAADYQKKVTGLNKQIDYYETLLPYAGDKKDQYMVEINKMKKMRDSMSGDLTDLQKNLQE